MSQSRVRVVLISAVLLSAAAGLLAQTTEPEFGNGKFTPIPATQAADPSSPRGVLKQLVGAMQDGDADKIKSLIATTNPTEDKMVAAMANMSVSQKKFRAAAVAAYGDKATDLTGDTEEGTKAGLAKIDAAPEVITGDTATVDPANGQSDRPGVPPPPPLTLKKIDGKWEIPVAELARGVDEHSIQQRLDDLAFMSQMMNDSADEVSKGMYKTPQEAGQAIQGKMMAAMMKRASAATQTSTTEPATAPAQ